MDAHRASNGRRAGLTPLGLTAGVVSASAVAFVLGFGLRPDAIPTTLNTPDPAGAAASSMAANTYQFWSAVGSSGIVDDADLGRVKFTGATAVIHPSAPDQEQVTIRYNVTANPNLEEPGSAFIGMRFRDNGGDARVVLRLKQVPYDADMQTTLLTIDSNDYAPLDAYQYQNESSIGPLTFDFERYFYYVEATITRNSDAGNPALKGIFVGK